ncbi:nuclear transport factor 2 family protein [Flavivirga spongiicola]|uniref:Nuclear transport factor 2 family protein n=1 Tax=Flavivirga spongiicola TaxID=421621 RepID=A0ABU7XNR0_9FLAO|nr:nuclear transport factor 2 family protein [Flavivirga sp. MEBiC05379]MDO5981844.1 nuclear transport factor 2 family protein [Flavivirga sp. MEBiC05379]
MKLFKTFLTFILVVTLSQCVNKEATQEKTKIDLEQQLLESIDKFNKAFQEGNVKVLESMITENYLHTNGNSKSIRKKDWINYLSKREKEIQSGNLEVIEYKLSETEIELYGNTAMVTGKVTVSNKKSSDIKNNEYRITNIWVYESGAWKRAGFHDGKIK